MKIPFNNYKSFWKIALINHNETIKCCNEKNKINITNQIDEIDSICIQNAKIEKHAMISIVFSIMTLESFINNYAIENFSNSYFKNYLDNLNLKSKILLIPKLVKNNQIDTNSESFCLLNKTLKIRDRLVHDKTKYIDVSKPFDYEWLTEKESKTAIDAVIKIVSDLKKIDSNIDIDWINNVNDDEHI